MPKVKYLTTSAGPGGTIQPGRIVKVSKELAQQLIDGHYAVMYEKDEESKVAPEMETAVSAEQEETTVAEQPKPKRGRPSKAKS